eukprot:8152144-Alexandrium_andersonii.AAC.1
MSKRPPESALPLSAGEAKDSNDRSGVGSAVPWWKAVEAKEWIAFVPAGAAVGGADEADEGAPKEVPITPPE